MERYPTGQLNRLQPPRRTCLLALVGLLLAYASLTTTMGSRPIAKTLPKALTSQVNSLTHSSKHPSLALKFAQKPIRSFLRRLEPMRCRELRAHALIDSSRAAKVGREVGDLDGAKEKESGNGLGSEEKQKIVADVRKAKKDLDRSVDGLLLIEHLNLNVMNATVGDAFY
eukprot:1358885-Amorphochlora_amoeboformis.AAC.1